MEPTTPTSEVSIYTTQTCHFCHLAKDYFTAHNVAFTSYDVGVDAAKRQEMVDMTGQLGVPVIKIGNDVIIGFDKAKIAELLHVPA